MNTLQLAQTLPSSWYRSPEVFGTEKERIFCREWVAACREEELPAPGDHLVLDVLGESVLLVRNRAAQLRAFYNVCRHRGSRLCRTPGETAAMRVLLPGGISAGRMIVCPYHQWSYDLDGALVAAPHLSTAAGFKKQDFHLYPIGVDNWGGFVFLNLSPAEAQPLAAGLGGIPRSPATLSARRIAHRRDHSLRSGGELEDHLRELQRVLSLRRSSPRAVRGGAFLSGGRRRQSGLGPGIPHRQGAYTFTHSGTTARRAFPGLDADEQVRHKGELVYPNLFLSVACDHVAAFILQPRGAERTDITCHFLFETHEISKPGFRSVGRGGILGFGQQPRLGRVRGGAGGDPVAASTSTATTLQWRTGTWTSGAMSWSVLGRSSACRRSRALRQAAAARLGIIQGKGIQ